MLPHIESMAIATDGLTKRPADIPLIGGGNHDHSKAKQMGTGCSGN